MTLLLLHFPILILFLISFSNNVTPSCIQITDKQWPNQWIKPLIRFEIEPPRYIFFNEQTLFIYYFFFSQITTTSDASLTDLIEYLIYPTTLLILTKWDNSSAQWIYLNGGIWYLWLPINQIWRELLEQRPWENVKNWLIIRNLPPQKLDVMSFFFFSCFCSPLFNFDQDSNGKYKTPTFTGIPPCVTILTMLEGFRTSQDSMADEVSGNIVE